MSFFSQTRLAKIINNKTQGLYFFSHSSHANDLCIMDLNLNMVFHSLHIFFFHSHSPYEGNIYAYEV